MDLFLVGVGSSLVASILAGAVGYLFRGQRFRQKVTAAPEKYVAHLDRLISSAVMEGVGRSVINARAIVAARDDLRDSLLSLTSLLDSEIDVLQQQLEILPRFGFELFELRSPLDRQRDRPGRSDDRDRYDAQQLFETIEVLAKKWPAKRDQIKYALRKMIAELGLDEA
jgi:hypothetical protein